MKPTYERLLRSRHEKMIAGVAGGISEYLEVDPLITRLVFVLLTLGAGIGPVVYIVLWLIMPQEPEGHTPSPPAARPTTTNRNHTLGTLLVVLGGFLLISKLLPWIHPFLIPIVLIGAGILIYRRAGKTA